MIAVWKPYRRRARASSSDSALKVVLLEGALHVLLLKAALPEHLLHAVGLTYALLRHKASSAYGGWSGTAGVSSAAVAQVLHASNLERGTDWAETVSGYRERFRDALLATVSDIHAVR